MKTLRVPELPDIVVIEPRVHHDARGFLLETWHAARYREAGIAGPFVQDVHSHSVQGVLRGIHFQHPHGQGKLVRVVHGSVFDVAVDVRVGSETFGRWCGIELSAQNHRQMWIPPGFGHGFLTLSATADVAYRCTEHYAPESSHVLAWNDPAVGIAWPVVPALLSDADTHGATLVDLEARGVLPELAR